MKSAILLLLILFTLQSEENYEKILKGLELNSVLLYEKMDKAAYYEYFGRNKRTHKRDIKIYNEVLNKFYNAEANFLVYLLKYENDTIRYCNWVQTKNPFQDKIGEDDMISASRSAIILIDNYLIRNKNGIVIRSYINKIKFKDLQMIIIEGKTRLNIERLYFNYISQISTK